MEIISVDVPRGMDVGTAKPAWLNTGCPPPPDRSSAHCQSYSAAQFVRICHAWSQSARASRAAHVQWEAYAAFKALFEGCTGYSITLRYAPSWIASQACGLAAMHAQLARIVLRLAPQRQANTSAARGYGTPGMGALARAVFTKTHACPVNPGPLRTNERSCCMNA